MTKSLSVLLLLTNSLGSVFADEQRDNPPTVLFDRFPTDFHRTQVSAASGTPASKADLHSPFPDDFPPHTTVIFEDVRKFPAYEKGGRYFIPAQNGVNVYRITDVERAPYKTIQESIATLKKLLKDRPKEVPVGEFGRSLPDYPPRNAGHSFHAKLCYVDTAWGSGIFYLTQFTQEPGDFANNEKLTYIFQGLSKDGDFYVSADFRITHPKLPSGIDAKPKQRNGGSRADTMFLNKQADESFTPSLRKVREWTGTMQFK